MTKAERSQKGKRGYAICFVKVLLNCFVQSRLGEVIQRAALGITVSVVFPERVLGHFILRLSRNANIMHILTLLGCCISLVANFYVTVYIR